MPQNEDELAETDKFTPSSEVMSAQTTVARAAVAWARSMQRRPTVEALAGASLTDVLGEWQGRGCPPRARDLQRSSGSPPLPRRHRHRPLTRGGPARR
jgi:hypothetical protein